MVARAQNLDLATTAGVVQTDAHDDAAGLARLPERGVEGVSPREKVVSHEVRHSEVRVP